MVCYLMRKLYYWFSVVLSVTISAYLTLRMLLLNKFAIVFIHLVRILSSRQTRFSLAFLDINLKMK